MNQAPTTGFRAQWQTLSRRWGCLVVLAAGIALYEILRAAAQATQNLNLVPALIVLGAAVAPISFVAFVAGRRLAFAVGAGLVATTALIGGVIGLLSAVLLEYRVVQSLGVLPMFLVGHIEEAAKLMVPAVVLVLTRRTRHPADGLLLGVASGAGFAALETMGYAFTALASSSGDLTVMSNLLYTRGLLSPAGHMAWTGLAAVGLWWAASQHWSARGIAGFLLVYWLVVGLHTTWDVVGTVGYIPLALVAFCALTWATHRLAGNHPPIRPSPVDNALAHAAH